MKEAIKQKVEELVNNLNVEIEKSVLNDSSGMGEEYMQRKLEKSKLVIVKGGRRYVKINRGGGEVAAFVDMENGDVLKAATYRAPAKHARGNVFSDQVGREAFGEVYHGLVHVHYIR